MDYLQKLIVDIELQSVEGIKECFQNGVSPNDTFRQKPLIYELIGNYPRGPEFSECVRVFVDHGLNFPDKLLLAVLMNDVVSLDALLTKDPGALKKTYTLDCAFTQILEASLLHISAEFNHVECAEVLVRHGADVNCKAGLDQYGFGGQTPIFHTVNQHANKCIDAMRFLISHSADLSLTVKGLIWGRGYPWETFIPSVNPLSYAMMGLLRQFQRKEDDVYEVVAILLNAEYGISYTPPNVPNRYLKNDS